MTNGWAYIDTSIYWNSGCNKIGEYGMVDFLSDHMSRSLTRQYRNGEGLPGYMMPDQFYVIRVLSKTKDEAVFALYDDIAHDVLFDEGAYMNFIHKMLAFAMTDKTGDIVEMAKQRLKTKE